MRSLINQAMTNWVEVAGAFLANERTVWHAHCISMTRVRASRVRGGPQGLMDSLAVGGRFRCPSGTLFERIHQQELAMKAVSSAIFATSMLLASLGSASATS